MSAFSIVAITLEGLYAVCLIFFSLSPANFKDTSEYGVALLQIFALCWGFSRALACCLPPLRSQLPAGMLLMELVGLLSIIVYVSNTSNLSSAGMLWRAPIVFGAMMIMVWSFVLFARRIRAQQLDVILESPKQASPELFPSKKAQTPTADPVVVVA